MSGDLRAAVEGLPTVGHHVDIDAVLALIPEGAVLVTEETLAAALDKTDVLNGSYYGCEADGAAAVLRHLREGT